MLNDNALQGIRCPHCKQEAEFRIEATAVFDVTDEGTGDYTNVEWTQDSNIECEPCGRTGTIKDFTITT